MKAVLLVGGEGTRLRPLTLSTPKPLLPVAGIPFIDRQIAWLAGHGVTEVVLAMGYRSERFVDHFQTAPGDGPSAYRSSAAPALTLHLVIEPEPLGTAGAIRFATRQAGIDERVIVCNGDVLTTLDCSALVEFHERRGAAATIHLTRVEDPSPFGVVPTAADGEVEAFVEKPRPGHAPTDWINAGTYVLEPSVLAMIPEHENVSIERTTFPHLLEQPGHLYALGTDDYWLDLGTPEKYLEAHADVLAGRLGWPPAPGVHEHTPGIWIHDDASTDGAMIAGPALVCADVRAGADVRIARSVVGRGSVLDAGATVEDSVLLEGVHLGAGAQVRGSIVGPFTTVAPGAVLDGTVVGAEAQIVAP